MIMWSMFILITLITAGLMLLSWQLMQQNSKKQRDLARLMEEAQSSNKEYSRKLDKIVLLLQNEEAAKKDAPSGEESVSLEESWTAELNDVEWLYGRRRLRAIALARRLSSPAKSYKEALLDQAIAAIDPSAPRSFSRHLRDEDFHRHIEESFWEEDEDRSQKVCYA